MPYYAVHGAGVFDSWDEAKRAIAQIKPGPRYKKFHLKEDAVHFAQTGRQQAESKKGTVYTDGSSVDGRGGIGVYFGPEHPRNLSESFMGTNNQGELLAIKRAVEIAMEIGWHSDKTITIHTDSTYAKNALETWRAKWEAPNFNGGQIQNRAIIEPLWKLMDSCPYKISLFGNKAHAGILGNEMADKLAFAATQKNLPVL